MARKNYRAIGLMSGTSLDGVDAALIETDGEAHERTGAALTIAFDRAFADDLEVCLEKARTLTDRNSRPPPLDAVEDKLNRLHANAVKSLLEKAGLPASAIDVIGFHGQTVLHRPHQGLTVQLGDGARLAALTGIDVVSDFRAADVAAGGEGAPFAPVYHRALVQAANFKLPVAVVNIGGVANITWIGEDGAMLAFDTGPGNAPLDDWMVRHSGVTYDQDGACAARGTVDQAVLATLMSAPYFSKTPPKSLDRNDFSYDALERLSEADGAATLVAFIVQALAAARAHLPAEPGKWIICGGGRHNKTLMSALKESLGAPAVVSAEEAGWCGDDIEAEAFAFLAVRSLRGEPLSYPGTTGVSRPLTGGVLSRAR